MKKKMNAFEKKLILDEITFYSICGDHDQEMILGQAPMSFNDFRRLSLITDYLELKHLNQYIWDTYGDQFVAEADELSEKCKKQDAEIPAMLMETGKWLDDFWKQAPNNTVAYLLREIFSQGLDSKQED